LPVQATNWASRFEVTTDGTGVVGHAGAALLGELADRLGLTRALGWQQAGVGRHPDAAVLRDLALVLADGGNCRSDLAVLRDQPELFGPVASTPTAWRVIERVATDPDGLARLRAARAIAFVAAASLTGLAGEEAQNANFAVGGLSLRGLLLAGIIIGGLGVLDDVTMSQVSLVTELHHANPTAGMAALVGGALRVGRDHIAATVNTLFLAYAGAALPLLILFVTGQDSLGTVATTEIVAVEIVRALCGSVGLVAAVPLTTILAALVATDEPPPGQTHATTGARHAPEAESAPPVDAATTQGRSGWGLTRGLSREQAALVWDRVLAIHGPHLSHAIVDVDGGAWLTAEELPAEVKTAASRLRQLAADAQRGASWYQRARTGGLVQLDLGHPEQLELLRRYGPFTTDARVWVHRDPNPVVETGDTFGDLPRFTYRLDQTELQHVQALLAEAGLTSSTLVPRRLRATRT
jgi:hypothetical protein